jgi:hypothetical protein
VWQTTLLFGFGLFIITGPSVFFFDYLAGAATLGFGVSPSSGFQGIGMFYLYMVSYFSSLAVILPALLTGRFGTATAVFLPYVVIGFPINYYFEWVIHRTWMSPFSGLGWTAAFLLTGFSVDMAQCYLPKKLRPAWRSILSGVVMGLVSFAVTVAALDLVYVGPLPTNTGSFVGIAYFGLPWMVISSAFGGYTAYSLSRAARHCKKRSSGIPKQPTED